MPKGRLHILILLAATIVSACVYSDYDHYYVDPIADVPPVISATTNLDTMYNPEVFDSLEVIYDIDIQNGELYYLEATVGNDQVYDSDTTRGSFWLYPDDAQAPGIDTLTMTIYHSSNSNSLGDVLGIEALNTRIEYAIDFIWTLK